MCSMQGWKMRSDEAQRIKDEMSKAIIDFSDVSMTREEMSVFITGWDKCLIELNDILDQLVREGDN